MSASYIILVCVLLAAAACLYLRMKKEIDGCRKQNGALAASLKRREADSELEWRRMIEAVASCRSLSGETPVGLIFLQNGSARDGGGGEPSKGRCYCGGNATGLLNWPSSLDGFNGAYEDVASRLKDLTAGEGERIVEVDKDGILSLVEIKSFVKGEILLATVRDVTKNIEEEQKSIFAERHDVLTGYYRHEVFLDVLRDLLNGGEDLGAACLVLFEVESLSVISDKYGQPYADAYVKSFAKLTSRIFRAGCLFSRYSSDSFYAFIYGYENEDSLKRSLDNLFDEAEKTAVRLESGTASLPLKFCAGLAWYPRDSADYAELLTYAKFTAYFRQKAPVKRFYEFNLERYLKEGYLLNSRESFLQFIERKLVRYAFQAIVDVSTAKVYGYEMLMRPQEPGLKKPTDVLNLARLYSKLHIIESMTWFEAMKAYMEQVENGLIPYNTKVFINSIGGVSLTEAEMETFHEKYYDYVKNLVIEITETERDDDESIRIKRQAADKWKAMIAIDDYGSGYNGAVSLLNFQPHILKVDISIIKGVDHDGERLSLLKNIIQYAKQRNIRVLAEGVDTGEELKTVIDCGVDLVQGFYLSAPGFVPRDISSKLRHEIGVYKYGG